MAAAALMCVAYLPGTLWSQSTTCWTGSGTVWTSCNVGIGTTSPARKLDIVDSSSVFQMRFSTGSNEGGIGADGNGFSRVVGTIGGAFGYGSASQHTFTEVMRFNSAGNVGIGTTSPQHMLHVVGTIGATEVIVSPTGADYVFKPDYRLAPLTEVAAFIKENQHLPDIPSAREVEEKGVGLGDMQSRLLAKIEELTLHMIDAEKDNAHLRQDVKELRQQIDRLEVAR
jgi:hypothetical protein